MGSKFDDTEGGRTDRDLTARGRSAKASRTVRGKSGAVAAAPWVATAIGELRDDDYVANDRMNALRDVVLQVLAVTTGPGVITFAGGWFESGSARPQRLVNDVSTRVAALLAAHAAGREVAVCVGVDGRDGRDQLGVAIGASGVVAAGRKFHPTRDEAGTIESAADWRAGEGAHERVFEIAGRRFFIGVCYDVFGVTQRRLPDPRVDALLGLVHSFRPRGEGGSSDVLFARHGFAGAAKQWSVPVFGAVKFRRRTIPSTWPSGVAWNLDESSTTAWAYEHNTVAPTQVCETAMRNGRVVTRVFSM